MNITNKDYFTFNVHNSALVVGQTGSGKTELVRTYIQQLEETYTPDQLQYAIFDLKMVEFQRKGTVGAKEEYLLHPVLSGGDQGIEYLDALADLSQARANADNTTPFIFIYIEECDLAMQYPGRFHDAVIRINHNAKKANMKLIFSTSRPSTTIVTKDLLNSFDLVLSGTLSSEVDERTVGIPGATKLNQYEFAIREIKSN